MTIERYSFRPGVALNLRQPDVELTRIVEANQRFKEVLATGEYDLTPEIWSKFGSNRYRYNLLVHEDGTGTLRLIPTGMDSINIELSSQGSSFKQGGKTFRIPEDAVLFPIAGPKRGDVTMRVYEIVGFSIGRSPQQVPEKENK